jgi:hypothetical protein
MKEGKTAIFGAIENNKKAWNPTQKQQSALLAS